MFKITKEFPTTKIFTLKEVNYNKLVEKLWQPIFEDLSKWKSKTDFCWYFENENWDRVAIWNWKDWNYIWNNDYSKINEFSVWITSKKEFEKEKNYIKWEVIEWDWYNKTWFEYTEEDNIRIANEFWNQYWMRWVLELLYSKKKKNEELDLYNTQEVKDAYKEVFEKINN